MIYPSFNTHYYSLILPHVFCFSQYLFCTHQPFYCARQFSISYMMLIIQLTHFCLSMNVKGTFIATLVQTLNLTYWSCNTIGILSSSLRKTDSEWISFPDAVFHFTGRLLMQNLLHIVGPYFIFANSSIATHHSYVLSFTVLWPNPCPIPPFFFLPLTTLLCAILVILSIWLCSQPIML